MYLYLLSQTVIFTFDTYDSCVVVAEDEASARLITPDGEVFDGNGYYANWATSPEDVVVKYLGVAAEGMEAGTVICASYNAG